MTKHAKICGLALSMGLRLGAAAAPPDVAAPPPNAIHTGSGLAMTVLQPGSGTARPRGDDCVIVTFTAWKRDGSLFSTSGLHGETSTQCLTAAIPGIAEALTGMTPGEKRRIWVPSDLAFAAHVAHHGTKMMHAGPPPVVDLTFEVELVRIMKAADKPPDLKTPPPTVFRTSSGLAIQVLKPGVGAKHPNPASRVTLSYTGWTADGKLFESTVTSGHPAVFSLGTTLAGWREGLKYMVAGEKARLWIPAELAYGDRPADKMVPAGDLVYDIELIDFQ
jgi:FKBP-type peptidyl-prolyl cis-trans isomerase